MLCTEKTIANRVGGCVVHQPSTIPVIAVLVRLHWSSRKFVNFLSGPLLRDYFLGRSIPPVGSSFPFRLFDRHSIFVHVVFVSPCKSLSLTVKLMGTEETMFYVIPPLPPWLCSNFLVPFPTTSFVQGGDFADMLRLTVSGSLVLAQVGLKPPQIFLVHAPFGYGKSSLVSWATYKSGATLVRLRPTDILPYATRANGGVYGVLARYIAAAMVAAPAVILLDDAHFVFPDDENIAGGGAAAALPLLADRLHACSRVALVLTVAPRIAHVHTMLRAVVDATLVLRVALDSSFACSVAQCHALPASASSAVPCDFVACFRAHVARFHSLAQVVAWARTFSTNLVEKGTDILATSSDDDKIVVQNTSEGNVDTVTLPAQWYRLHDDFPGVDDALRALQRVLLWPRTRLDSIRHLGLRLPRGILLYGAPGTGKTMIVRASTRAAHYTVLPVDAATIVHGEVGETESRLADIFARAIRSVPCAVFFDEIDALFGGLGGSIRPAHAVRLVVALTRCFDGLPPHVVILAATNRPWDVASTLLRPGRFDYTIKLGLPGKHERARIASVYARKMALGQLQSEFLIRVSGGEQATGFSGADIAAACRRATLSALWRGFGIENADLLEAFRFMRPSISETDLSRIDMWRQR